MQQMQQQQSLQQQQQQQEPQQPHGDGSGTALFASLNRSTSPKLHQTVNPLLLQGMMGQDNNSMLFGQLQQQQQQQQPSMRLGNFQVNAPFAPNSLLGLHHSAGGIVEDKRKSSSDDDGDALPVGEKPIKKARTDDDIGALGGAPAINLTLKFDDDGNAPAPVDASKAGTDKFEENDVLSGRGGGTNVHPGNRNFRELINLHRKTYLKARKNDKPAISRAIVRAIRESGGRFLKKGNKSDLWYEIGDFAAREKTSQALRQRAPEMRKLLFDTEREEARVVAEDHIRRQGMFVPGVNMNNAPTPGTMWGGHDNNSVASGMINPALFQAMAANNKLGSGQDATNHQFSTMFSAALLQNGMNRFTSNGA